MAAAIKYQFGVTDHFGQQVSVKIWEDGYVGAIFNLQPAGESPIVINWKGETDQLRQPIIGSELRLALMERKDIPIIDDVLMASDRQYLVTVETYDPSEGAISNRWCGFIVPDQIEYNFNYQPDIIRIRAIDPLIALKGLQMKRLVPIFDYGLQPLRKFFNTWWIGGAGIGFADVIGSWWDIEMLSDLSLTPEYQTDILDSVGVLMETMHDEDGKLITYYEAMERICNALNMRCHMDNGKIMLVDLINYNSAAANFLGTKQITYKEHPSTNVNTDIVLLGNSEDITRQVALKETKARFPYKSLVGLVRNGNLLQWSPHPIHGGNVPDHWQMNSVLLGSNYWDRRVGSGRVESPYSYFMQNVDIDSMSGFEKMTVKANAKVRQKYTIEYTYRMHSTDRLVGGEWYEIIQSWMSSIIVAYNVQNPAKSLVLNYFAGDLRWGFFNATVWPSFEDGLFPNVSSRGPLIEIESSVDWVTKSIELPPIMPWSPTGEDDFVIYFSINPFWSATEKKSDIVGAMGVDAGGDMPDPFTDVDWYPPYYIREVKITQNVDARSQVVYVSRNNKQTSKGDEIDVLLNTSLRPEAAGTLYSMIPWEHVSEIHPPYQPLQSLFRFTESWQWNVNIPEMNAISQLWLSAHSQSILSLEGRVKVFRFSNRMRLQRFYDAGKPFTEIYNSYFTNNAAEWDLKSNEIKFTVHSIKIEKEYASMFVDEPNTTYDKLEIYDSQS